MGCYSSRLPLALVRAERFESERLVHDAEAMESRERHFVGDMVPLRGLRLDEIANNRCVRIRDVLFRQRSVVSENLLVTCLASARLEVIVYYFYHRRDCLASGLSALQRLFQEFFLVGSNLRAEQLQRRRKTRNLRVEVRFRVVRV